MINDDIENPLGFTLQQRALHELSKICWGKFVLKEAVSLESDCTRSGFATLINHRNEIINNIPELLPSLSEECSIHLPESVREKTIEAVYRLEQGYSEALSWEEIYRSSLPFTVFNPETAGEYHASCFIDQSGHFDDLAWAKRFVADKNQFIQNRFVFACFYCFEDDIDALWSTMEDTRQLPCKGMLKNIKSAYGNLVLLWVFKLYEKFDELDDDGDYEDYDVDYRDGFLICGFREALFRRNEYAVRFFWENCSAEEKLDEIKYDVLNGLYYSARKYQYRIVYFIYSRLSFQEKIKYLFLVNASETAVIWSHLLESPFYECALDDILAFPKPIPDHVYETIFTILSYKISEPGMPIHHAIFRELWKHISTEKRKYVVEKGDIIESLVQGQVIDLLEIIIQPLSHSLKDKILLNDYKKGGKSAFNEFCKVGNYEIMTRYLLCFLINRDTDTQKSVLRIDSSKILAAFTEKMPEYRTDDEVSENVKKGSLNVIENVQGSLMVLKHILEKSEISSINELACISLQG